MVWVLLGLVGWMLCGSLTWFIMVRYLWDQEFHQQHLRELPICCVFGLIGLGVAVIALFDDPQKPDSPFGY